MADFGKFKDESVAMLLKHAVRELSNDSNKDIIEEKSVLNYSIEIDLKGKSPEEFYRDLVADSYLYGRGSKREKEAVTCCSWVVTLPRQVSDYYSVGKDEIIYLNPDEERQFFQAAYDFISARYGKENFFRADVHYDEAGQPHMHAYWVCRKEIDHDLIHFKTVKTNTTSDKKRESWIEKDGCLYNRKGDQVATKIASGRWEYVTKYKYDENGEKIPLRNYARDSDLFDFKLAAAEIINPIELRYFHPDFESYLQEHDIPGAGYVHTGVTGGKNISVKSLKEFTKTTGLTLDQVKDIQHEKVVLEERIITLEKSLKNASVTLSNNDLTIAHLQGELAERDLALERTRSVTANKAEMDVKLRSKEQELTAMKQEYNKVCQRLQAVQAQLAERTVDKSEISAKDREIAALKQELSSVKRDLREVQQIKDAEIATKDKEIERLRQEKVVQQTKTKVWGSSSAWGESKGWSTERSAQTWEQESTWNK